MPLVLRLLALVCALAALSVPGVVAATAAGEVVTTPTEENPPGGEATSKPVVPPVKEVSEKAATPKREGSGAEEPTAAPQTTAPTSPSAPTTGESSGSSSTPTATAPTKVSTGTTQTSSSSTRSGGSHEGGTDVHHATGLGGATPNATGTDHQSTQGGGDEVATEPTYVGASEVAGVATTSTKVGEAESPADPQPQAGPATRASADPPVAAKLDNAQAVEHAPVAKPDPSPSPLRTVGHALSRPFEEPTSTSALFAYLCLLLGALAIGLVFWFEIGGSPERAYWYRRKLTDMLGWGRRGRNAG
jgi:hypothetical protein